MSPISYIAQVRRLAAHRSYRRLLIGGSISALGDRIGYFAFLAAVTSQSGDPLAVGGITVAELLPTLIAAPIVSLIIDRYDRRKLMVVADVVRGLLFASVAIWPDPRLLYVAAFVSAAFTQLFEPCRQALEPHYVPEGELTQASGIRMGVMSMVMVVGPSLGGIIVAFASYQAAFAINAVSFMLSAWMVSDLDPVTILEKVATGTWREIMGGVTAVRENAVLLFLFAMLAAFYLVIGIQFPLIYVFVKESLHGGPRELGWLLSGIGIGGIMGGAWLASLKKGVNPFDSAKPSGRRNLAGLVVLDGAVVIAFAGLHALMPVMALFAIFGFIGTVLQTTIHASVATQTSDAIRGRVASLFSAMSGSLIVVSIGLGTPLARIYGTERILQVSGGLELAAGFIAIAIATGVGTRRSQIELALKAQQ